MKLHGKLGVELPSGPGGEMCVDSGKATKTGIEGKTGAKGVEAWGRTSPTGSHLEGMTRLNVVRHASHYNQIHPTRTSCVAQTLTHLQTLADMPQIVCPLNAGHSPTGDGAPVLS